MTERTEGEVEPVSLPISGGPASLSQVIDLEPHRFTALSRSAPYHRPQPLLDGKAKRETIAGMMRWLIPLFVFLALTSAASGEELPDIEIPQQDYGLWVPVKSPCSSPLNIIIGKDGITFHNNGETHHFRDVDVALSCASGSSGDSIAHCISPSRDENLALYLHLFPGEDTDHHRSFQASQGNSLRARPEGS